MMNRDRITRSRTTYGSSGTTIGLDERLERTLLYPLSAVLAIFTPLGWLIGLAVFLIEKNRNVRAHAVQAGVIFGVLSIARWLIGLIGGLLSHIWVVGLFIGGAFGLIAFILFWIIIAIAVWETAMVWLRPGYRLPYIGKFIDTLFAKWL
jgi:uncharacterized membrane protein